jgi:hypothetical protein
MKWTKQHSVNAVAAKARRRIAPGPALTVPRRYVPHPKPRAKWRLQLRDEEHGHSITVRLYRTPWPGRWHHTAGDFSLDELLRRMKCAINRAA